MVRLRHNGFTLIELLVVVVIIGVLTSLAVLSLGDGGKRDHLLEEGRRLAALIQLASDQAVLEGREWGLRIAPDGYLFMFLKDGKWQEVTGDKLFRARQLASGFKLELRMEDVAVTLTPPDNEGNSKTDKSVVPQVYLMSSAERTPFEVVITAPGGTPAVSVKAPLMGAVVMQERTHP